MIKWNLLFLHFLVLGLFTLPGHAEVRLEKNYLTVQVKDTIIEEVLDELGRQGEMKVIAFEDTRIGNVRISKTFWNLPLEEGLDRLLSNWNYGLSRDKSTGRITTLYIVSKRIEPPTQLHSPSRYTDTRDNKSSTQETIDDSEIFESEEDDEEEEFDADSGVGS